MPYTFECGTCNSVYRIDDHQITKDGVKITCPKCLSFFIMKSGTRTLDKPVIEHIVSDGEHEVKLPEEQTPDPTPEGPKDALPLEPKTPPEKEKKPKKSKEDFVKPSPPAPPEKTFDVPMEPSIGESLKASIPIGLKTQEVKPTRDFVPPPKSSPNKPKNPKLSRKDLGEYLPEPKPAGKVMNHYIMPISIGVLLIMFVIILGFVGVIRIPGISSSTSSSEPSTTLTPEPEPEISPKYGFPEVETDYDPWADSK